MSNSTTRTTIVVDADAICAISQDRPLAAQELAYACGTTLEWVVQLEEAGIVGVPAASDPPQTWCFGSGDLQNALDARRLERDFGVDLQAAALILDLQREVRRLKAALRDMNAQVPEDV